MSARETPEPPAPGRRYQEVGRIGEGAEGLVVRTFDTSLQRLVAVKELLPTPEPHALARFTREARLLCYLDHPAIVPIYDRYVAEHGRPCYVMKLVAGRNLEERLGYRPGRSAHALPPSEAVAIVRAVAQALAHAHDRGVAHLDLKPANVMVGPYGEVFVMDWGNARLFDSAPYRALLGEHATDGDIALLVDEPPDMLSGTPAFMSPEQTARPRDQLGVPSDVFSLGSLLYLMLTGALPFAGRTIPDLLKAIREHHPTPAHERHPDVPRRLGEICDRMLAKARADRYPDLHAFLADLASYQEAGQGFPTRRFEAREVICDEGEDGEGAFAIVSGRVRVSKAGPDGPQVLADLGPGQIIGELAILTGQPRSATVTALEPTTVRLLGREAVDRELHKIAPWVGRIIGTVAERFLALNEECVRLRGSDPPAA